mmetsp:Transcript_23857/g.81329  ORF Transcript_23857/g.81329 Transcript_23857/m.81329 type:complete len:262 (+) Transcript_23857:2757-3542(+)
MRQHVAAVLVDATLFAHTRHRGTLALAARPLAQLHLVGHHRCFLRLARALVGMGRAIVLAETVRAQHGVLLVVRHRATAFRDLRRGRRRELALVLERLLLAGLGTAHRLVFLLGAVLSPAAGRALLDLILGHASAYGVALVLVRHLAPGRVDRAHGRIHLRAGAKLHLRAVLLAAHLLAHVGFLAVVGSVGVAAVRHSARCCSGVARLVRDDLHLRAQRLARVAVRLPVGATHRVGDRGARLVALLLLFITRGALRIEAHL